MSKEVKLIQISHKTYAIDCKNISGCQLSCLVQLVKKYGGRWNIMINLYEFPLQNASELLKQVKGLNQKIVIRDVPLASLRGVLSYKGKDEDKKVVYVLPKQKWNRMIALDPLLIKRFNFTLKFINGNPRQGKIVFKRVLLLCWQIMERSWANNLFQKYKLSYKSVDYQSLSPDQQYRVRLPALKEHQFQILTYERLLDVGDTITKKILQKYSTIICDDAQLWIEPQNSLYKSSDVAKVVKTILLQRYPAQKDLLLYTSRFILHKVPHMLDISNILLPNNFGINPILIAKGTANDANWIKKRYAKQGKNLRQLFYIFNSLLFINLLQTDLLGQTAKTTEHKRQAALQNYFLVNFKQEQLRRLKAIDSRYKHVNKKNVIASFQSERLIGSLILSDTSKLEQSKYIKQLRQAITVQKLQYMFKLLYHLSKDLKVRTAVVVENQWGQERLQRFMNEQQITYVVYQISNEELNRGFGYSKFNQKSEAKVCLIVREKLHNEYKAAVVEREKMLQIKLQQQAEAELGINKGGLFQLAQYKNCEFDDPYRLSEFLCLKKINTVHHVFFLDVFWYDFSPDKENILANIFDCRLPAFDQIQLNEVGRLNEDGTITNLSRFAVSTKRKMVKHFFIVKDSYEKTILQKYLVNIESHQQRQLKEQEQTTDLRLFTQHIFEKHKYEEKQIISGVFDIDQQFDRLQFETLQQEGLKNQPKKQQKIVYNTTIEGLIIQTQHVDQVKKTYCSASQDKKVEIHPQQQNINVADLSWLQSSEQQNDSQASSIVLNIDKYLINSKTQKQQPNCNLQSKSAIKSTIIKTPDIQTTNSGKKCNIKKQQSAQSYEDKQSITIQHISRLPLITAKSQIQPPIQTQIIKKINEDLAKMINNCIDEKRQSLFSEAIVNRNQARGSGLKKGKWGHALWKPRHSVQKQILRKLKKLRVKLTKQQSSLNHRHPSCNYNLGKIKEQ